MTKYLLLQPSASPYADLDEEVFMAPPPGLNIPEGYCLKLKKSLCGLKQAPRNCNKKKIKTNLCDECWQTNCVIDMCDEAIGADKSYKVLQNRLIPSD